MEAYGNPAFAQDTVGREVNVQLGPAFMPSHIVHIDSGERDTSSYPTAGQFMLAFSEPVHNVFSVELISIIFTTDVQVAQPPYLWLCSPQLRNYDSMVSTSRFANAPTNSLVVANAFAKLPVSVGASSKQIIERTERRAIKKFKNLKGKLSELEFSLVEPNGTIYIPTGEYFMTIEIVGAS